MHPVTTISVPAIGAFTNQHKIIPGFRGNDTQDTILSDQRRVIHRGQFKSLGIENRDVRVEQRGP